jgi:hypothetical protein
MSEVGALIVKLQAETAQFREDMGKVKSDLDDFKDKGEGAGKGFSASMGEAKGGLMLVEESVGVHLPRHLNALIAQIPLVGQAFAFMLPIAGVAVAIEVVGKLIDKHNELEKAIRKANIETEDATTKGEDEAKALSLTNLKLDDQIAKLEHKPAHNYVVEAILETSIAVDNLTAKYATDFAKMDDYLIDQTGWWDRLKRVMSDAWSGEGQGGANGGYGHTTEALWKVQHAMEAVTDARAKMAKAPLDQKSQTAAENELRKALIGQSDAIDSAIKSNGDYKDVVARLKIEAAQTASELNALNLTLMAGEKHGKIAGLDQAKDNLKPLEDQAALQKILASGVEQHSQALIKLARTQAETTMAGSKGGEDDSIDGKLAKQKNAIEAEKQDSIDAADASLKAKYAAFMAELKAAGGNAAKKKELEAQWTNDVQANTDAVTQINADANRQIVAADRDAANQRAAIAKALQQATADDALKAAITAADRQKKLADQAAKNDEALHRKTAAQTLQAEISANNAEINAEVIAYQTRLKNLDKFDKDYEKKVKELNDKIVEATRKGQDDETSIIAAAAQKQAMEIKSSEDRMKEAIAGDIANSIVMNKSLAASFRQTGEQMAEQMIKNLLMMELTGDKEKLIHAKNAYGKAFDAMSGIPPAPMWGYAAGAAAFAAVMSFEEGGKIPGSAVGSAGAVPIIGHQGETVVTKALTDRVEAAERGGNNGSSGPHTWNFSPQIHAMDAEGVDRVLAKHSSVFQRHVAATMRRMNK